MKALTFLEYFNQQEDKLIRNNPDLSPEFGYLLNFHLTKTRTYRNFISQPFRPEMIVEFFITDNWEYTKTDNYTDFFLTQIYSCKEKDLEIRYYGSGEHRYNINYKIGDKYRTDFIPKPLTLEQFISDCQRAGIELIFKEEIVKILNKCQKHQ